MLPDPLHPAVVHFPVVLSALLPLFAALILIAIRAGRAPGKAWAVVVLLQALLVASAWLAHETGEEDEERVEKVVDERLIEEHEEASDWVLWLAVVGLAPAGLGLATGSAGAWGRGLAFVLALAAFAAAARTGMLGGELVYRHGAANAYVERPAGAPAGAAESP